MEPAAGKREDTEVYGLACGKDQVPQWSPPLNGGYTRCVQVSWSGGVRCNGARR